VYICQEAQALAWNYTDQFVAVLHQSGQFPSRFFNLQVNNSKNDSFASIVLSGKKNASETGQYVQWDGLKQLHTWPNGDTTGANAIRGTEGFIFQPNLTKQDVSVFVDDIQRSLDLVYQEQPDQGVFQYGIDNNTFKGAFKEPRNARWGSWCPDGMFNIGPAQLMDIPMFASKPHFLDGDPLLLTSVEGLKPIRSKHDSVVNVNATTGAAVNFARKLQINIQVNKTEKRSTFEFPLTELSEVVGYNETGTLYFPVVYINEVNAGIFNVEIVNAHQEAHNLPEGEVQIMCHISRVSGH
jgi:lysosome membrane protein 2